MARTKQYIDLTGREFGRYTVLRRAGNRGPSGQPLWLCLCDPARGGCSAERVIRGDVLRAGKATQCPSCRSKANHEHETMRRHVARLTMPVHLRTCPTCGIEFNGTARQRYCSPVHRPSKRH